MRWLLILPVVLASLLLSHPASATCGTSSTGTAQTLTYLLNNEFQAGQPNASISSGCIRDLIASLGPGGGNIGTEIDFFLSGVPGSSATLAKTFSRQTVVAAGAPIKCTAITGATASSTVTLTHIVAGVSTTVGTLVFGSSGSAYQGCTVTFTFSVTFAVGDSLEAIFPSTADATLANISISVPATQ
jgi:hypothetical protein